MDEGKQKILKFIKGKEVGVISTLDSKDKIPESAAVVFSETKNLEIIFGTSNTSRKYMNLKENSHVSFVIGAENGEKSIQYEGIAREVRGDEEEVCRKVHLKKNPASKKYAYMDEQVYFIIEPKWIRFMDYSLDPIEMFEITF